MCQKPFGHIGILEQQMTIFDHRVNDYLLANESSDDKMHSSSKTQRKAKQVIYSKQTKPKQNTHLKIERHNF